MSNLQEMKKRYDNIPIPDALSVRVQQAIGESREKQLEKEQAARQRAAERRQAQIERQLINTGAQVLKRGLMNTLLGGGNRRR